MKTIGPWIFAFVAVFVPFSAEAQGFPNVAQTPGTLLSGLNAPGQGRLAIIAFHNGILFTIPEVPSSQPGSDFQVRTWNIADPTDPIELAQHGLTPMPVNAHGYLKTGDFLSIGSNWPPESPWSWQAGATYGDLTRTTNPELDCVGVRGCLFQPWFVGDTYWSYGEVAGDATIQRPLGNVLANWDHLGLTGVIGHPFLVGNLLIFASDQSRTGVATYDVSDPTNPALLDVLTDGGPGGYWPELWGGDGSLYVVFPYRTGGNGFRVVDLTDPTDLRFLVDRPLPGAASMYLQFQDHYAFMGDHKVDMRSFESVLFLDGDNVTRTNDGGEGIDTSQFALPIGNLLVTGGSGPNQGMAIWAHQAAPDSAGPTVGFHIPRAGQTNYPVNAPISLLIHETLETPTIVNGSSFIVRPVGGAAITGRLTFSFDDILTFSPLTDLLADTTYEVVIPAGGIEDVAGNGIEGYSFTFSTGTAVDGNAPPQISSFEASLYPVAPAGNLTLTATAVDPDSDPIDYRFDFGDGRPKTAWSSTANVITSYPSQGHYRATVQARDSAGSISSATTLVTVLVVPAGPRSTSSSTISCDQAGRRVWVVNPDNGSLAAVGADGLSVELEVPVCSDPRAIAPSLSGELWVSCYDQDRLVIVDQAGTLVDQIDTGYGSAPFGVVASPDGASIFVSLEGTGDLLRFDSTTRELSGSLFLGPTPRALAVSGDGSRVLVGRFLSAKDHAEVWDVAAGPMTLSGTLRIEKFGGDVNADGTASGRGVLNYLRGITIAPDGTAAWVTGNKPNQERGLLFGPDLDQDNTVRNVVVELDLTLGEVTRAIDIDNSDSASGLAFSPLGDYLLVALQGNNQAVLLDTLASSGSSGLGSMVTRVETGAAPDGVCADQSTNRMFVKNFMDRSISALETDALFRFGDLTVPASEVSTVASEALSASVLAGKRIFYDGGDPRMSAEGYLSCASCHLDGRHDGRSWDFTGRGEGLRNTTTLHGRSGVGHGNVHWSANFDEIQDFENDIRGAFGGSGFMIDSDFAATSAPLGPAKSGLSTELDALADYVTSLDRSTLPRSPYRELDGAMTASAVAGRATFAEQRCGSCHAGDEFTDSGNGSGSEPPLHDVGTLRTTSGGRLGELLVGIDTPTLLSIWDTPPYFHDGSAETLDDVFSVVGGQVVPAESGTPSDGAQIQDQYVHLNNDDSVHGRALVALHQTGARLTLTSVDGGSGGAAALELRYSVGSQQPIDIAVNGQQLPAVTLPSVGNDPGWWHRNWGRVRVEGFVLEPGETNTLELWTSQTFPNISLDEIVVSTHEELTAAHPHRRVLALSSTRRSELIDYLLQLDSQPEENPFAAHIFDDGFESGSLDSWSSHLP